MRTYTHTQNADQDVSISLNTTCLTLLLTTKVRGVSLVSKVEVRGQKTYKYTPYNAPFNYEP